MEGELKADMDSFAEDELWLCWKRLCTFESFIGLNQFRFKKMEINDDDLTIALHQNTTLQEMGD